MPLGGEPITVPSPPIDADQATDSSSAAANFRAAGPSPASRISDSAIGTIIAAVALFEIHMLTKAVAAITPAITRSGDLPARPIAARAILRSSPHRVIAAASMKPPRNRKITSLA